jgi:hypothetical protein
MVRCLTAALGAWFVATAAVALSTKSAHAQTPSAEGAVVAVERDDVIVDLGQSRGAADGDVVEIWRPLRLKHPVTGKVLFDRFVIGKLRLVQVRPSLSLAKPDGSLSRPPEAGDVVILSRSAPPSPAAEQDLMPAAPVAAAPPTGDDEGRALSQVFDSLRGADLATRIRAYESYAASHEKGRYAMTLRQEAWALRRLLVTAEREGKEQRSPDAEAQPIDRVVAGEPLRIALALRSPASGAVLHAREAGQPTYSSQSMTRVGSEYWSATVPADRVHAPALEWFIEAVAPEGTRPVVGSAESPQSSAVVDVQQHSERRVMGIAQIWTDFAAFDTKGNDYAWQTEGVMGGRFADVGIRAVRTGFGVYRGVSGTLQQLDVLNQPGTSIGLTYGYLEGELGIVPLLSIALRGIIGLQASGVQGGTSGFLRIGSDLSTNLLLGGEVLGGIGVRGIAEFDWNSFRDWPIVLRSEVTNQPAGSDGDVGVRLITQLGYRVLPHLIVSGRASYQGRTIVHAGPGGGAAVGYTW